MEKAVQSRLEKKPKMTMEIEPADNGGFNVSHRVKGSYGDAETHAFGPEKQGRDLLRHIKDQLGIGKAPMGKKPAQKKASPVMPQGVMPE